MYWYCFFSKCAYLGTAAAWDALICTTLRFLFPTGLSTVRSAFLVHSASCAVHNYRKKKFNITFFQLFLKWCTHFMWSQKFSANLLKHLFVFAILMQVAYLLDPGFCIHFHRLSKGVIEKVSVWSQPFSEPLKNNHSSLSEWQGLFTQAGINSSWTPQLCRLLLRRHSRLPHGLRTVRCKTPLLPNFLWTYNTSPVVSTLL